MRVRVNTSKLLDPNKWVLFVVSSWWTQWVRCPGFLCPIIKLPWNSSVQVTIAYSDEGAATVREPTLILPNCQNEIWTIFPLTFQWTMTSECHLGGLAGVGEGSKVADNPEPTCTGEKPVLKNTLPSLLLASCFFSGFLCCFFFLFLSFSGSMHTNTTTNISVP